AEAPVTFFITAAGGDAVEVVPDPQKVRKAPCIDEPEHASVGLVGGGTDVVVAGLIELDRAELEHAVAGPGDAVRAAMGDGASRAPDLQRRRAMRLQRDAEVAWIVAARGVLTVTEYRQHVRLAPQRRQVDVEVVARQPPPAVRGVRRR